MNPQCIKEVERTIGRKMRKGEAETIGERIQSNMQQLGRTEPGWRGLSAHERLSAAANLAREQDIAKADKQAQRKALNILAQTRNINEMIQRAPAMRKVFSGEGAKYPVHMALFERINQVANAAKGVRDDVIEKVLPALELAKSEIWGDKAAMTAFVHEVLRGGSKDPAVKAAVESYLEGSEALRMRANAAGMDVGKLDYNYLPNPHSTGKIARAEPDQYAADVLGMMQAEDRTRYVNADGSQKNDAQMMDTLRAIHKTISTEGTNKEPNAFRGQGSRASRADEAHRELHLVTPEAWISYNAKYGEGNVLEAVLRHVESSAKNIGMLEEMGPNPNATFARMQAVATHMDNKRDVQLRFATPQMAWDVLNGTTATPVSPRMAFWGQEARSFFGTAYLGGVVLTQITDTGRLMIAAKMNGIPLGKALSRAVVEVFSGKEHAKVLRRMGIGIEDMHATIGRWATDELFTKGVFSKMSMLLMKITGTRAYDRGERAGIAVNTMGALHDLKGTDWADLPANQRYRMEAAGMKEQDWKIYEQAEGSNYQGSPVLDKHGIRAIPDAKLDIALAGVHAQHEADARASINELDSKNQEEAGWLAKRQAGYGQALKDAAALIDRFHDAKDDATRNARDVLDIRAQALKAQLDMVTVAHAAGDNSPRALGRQEGSTQARITALEARARDIERQNTGAVNDKAGEVGKRMAAMRSELEVFAGRSASRTSARSAVMQRLADLEPQREATRVAGVNQAIAHLLGYLDAEGNNVIPRPDVLTRAGMMQGTRPGTLGGEGMRFGMLFKGFGFQSIARLGEQLRSVPEAKGKVGIFAATLASTALLGALSLQLKTLARGEDPEAMDSADFAGKAIAQGGGFGMVSEFMSAVLGGDQRGSKLGGLLGPAAETLGQIGDAIHNQRVATEQGKDSTLPADAVKIGLENTPMINAWYAKAILHHAFLDALQESMSPGYLERMRRSDEKRGTTRWMPRGDEPIRAPDLSHAVGAQ